LDTKQGQSHGNVPEGLFLNIVRLREVFGVDSPNT